MSREQMEMTSYKDLISGGLGYAPENMFFPDAVGEDDATAPELVDIFKHAGIPLKKGLPKPQTTMAPEDHVNECNEANQNVNQDGKNDPNNAHNNLHSKNGLENSGNKTNEEDDDGRKEEGCGSDFELVEFTEADRFLELMGQVSGFIDDTDDTEVESDTFSDISAMHENNIKVRVCNHDTRRDVDTDLDVRDEESEDGGESSGQSGENQEIADTDWFSLICSFLARYFG